MTDKITEVDVLKAVTAIASSALRREGHPTRGEVTIHEAIHEAVQALSEEGLWFDSSTKDRHASGQSVP